MKVALIIGEFHPPWTDGYLSYFREFVHALQKVPNVEVTLFSTINLSSLERASKSDLHLFSNYFLKKCEIIYVHKEMHSQPLRFVLKLRKYKDLFLADSIVIEYEKILPFHLSFLMKDGVKGKLFFKFISGEPDWNALVKTRILKFLDYLFKKNYGYQNKYLFSSEYLIRRYKVDPSDSIIVPPGIDTNFFKPVKSKEKNLQNFPTYKLLYFGKLSPNRFPYSRILEAIRLVKTKYKIKVLLKIIGKDSPIDKIHAKNILQLSNALGISKEVDVHLHLLDEIEKVKELNEAGIFLFPVEPTNFSNILDPPISVLEAMSCGKVVVCTPVGSLPKIIHDGSNGFILKNLNPLEIAYILSKILSERELDRIGSQARETIIRNFSLSVLKQKLTELFTHEMEDKRFFKYIN